MKIAIIPLCMLCLAFAFWPSIQYGSSSDSRYLTIDTLYAKLLLSKVDQGRSNDCYAACDIIVKYHFSSHFGTISSIDVHVLGGTTISGVCQDSYGACPPGIVQADSIRLDILEKLGDIDTALVSIALHGSLWDYSCDSDSSKRVFIGKFEYADTLVVPVIVAE